MIDPDGEIRARYDKIHLFDVELGGGESYRESALYDGGDSPVIVSLPDVSIGLSICYDLRFPHLYTALAKAGAQIILVPAAFTVPTGEAHWHTLLRARAIETGCWIVAAAQTGDHDTGRSTYGHSLVVSPWGEVVAEAGSQPGMMMVDLDLQKCEEARRRIPNLSHFRDLPDVTVYECGQ